MELSQWIAYKRAFGPLGNSYLCEVMASVLEQLQQLTYLTGAVNGAELAKPQRIMRPRNIFVPVEAEEEAVVDGGADALNAYFDNIEKKSK